MNLQTIKENINRGRLQFDEIDWLVETVEQLENEIELYKLQDTKLIAQLKMMKNNSRLINFYKMSEENLRLAQENAHLKRVRV